LYLAQEYFDLALGQGNESLGMPPVDVHSAIVFDSADQAIERVGDNRLFGRAKYFMMTMSRDRR
jgi:hypothetical protein